LSNNDYCFTKGCIQTAADLLDKLDETANPCDDFYQFACGSFIEETVIPDDRTRTSMFSILGDKLDVQVRGLLEGEIKASDPKPFQMAKSVFQSCMDKETIETAGLDPLKLILKKMGGWPLLEGPNWNEEGYKWYEMTYKFRENGYSVDYLVDFSVTTDLKNSSWRILDLDQPGLGMAREYLMKGLEDPDVQAYQEYMQDVALLLGADKDTVINDIKETIKFEIELAKISLPREERRDASKLYNPMRVSELTSLDPTTPWLEYINTILTTDIVQVSGAEIIIVDVPNYITNFSQLIQNTPKRVQANYLMWRAAAASMAYMNEAADKISLKFSKKLTGKSEEPPRWRKCVGAASGSLANAVGSLYVTKYFNEDSKTEALLMVSEIRRQFERLLDEVDWMDEDTKRQARVKAQGMVEHIGYPSELLEMSKLEDLYAGLELSPNAYLRNALNMTVFGTNYAFSKLREKVNKTDWVRHGRPAVVNAFYSPLENSIQFPAGILQGIFFSSDRPKYMNYGAIGWVIGHEITHGFDDQGRQFDEEGNLVDWWHPETKKRYLKKAQCIISQYGNYTIKDLDNMQLNGINTQGENIADNGGIKEAYRAYNSWVSRNGAEPRLPGVNYTPRQLFWVSAANVWCAKYRPKALKLRVLTGVHSPDQFRVQGPFSNMDDFSRDFNCPVGSNMNPPKENKCQVW
jgi:predicted metalloendopeptidase